MAATKFTETEREKLFAQLEVPFDPAQIKWRVLDPRGQRQGNRNQQNPGCERRDYQPPR